MATVAVVALSGATALSPANAQRAGVNFSYDTGGYCDSAGCPDEFWDLPIYDCPVFYRGQWYMGPVYYRHERGTTWYWVRGDWRSDEWSGPRPDGFCVGRLRPALGFDFYERHGFHMRDEDRHHGHRGGHRDWDDNWGGRDRGSVDADRRDDRRGHDRGRDRDYDRGHDDGPSADQVLGVIGGILGAAVAIDHATSGGHDGRGGLGRAELR